MTAAGLLDLSRFIKPGDGIWWSQTSAEPTPLITALLDQVDRIGSVRAFVGMTSNTRLTTALPENLHVVSYGALGDLRALSKAGRLEVIPCNYSALPRLFEQGELPHDVGLVQVSPPDADGLCSLGVGVDYIADAVAHTRTLIAEINQQMPSTIGSAKIPLSRFAATIETDRPLLEFVAAPASHTELAIAAHVAGLIEDGDTIQLGVGALPSAVLAGLTERSDLGVHSGMISDGIADLIDRGVINGTRKEIDRGIVVTGAALGTSTLYERVRELGIQFRPASYTHSPETLSQLRRLVSVNSAIEVDLTGQVNAERRHGTYIGAVGGQSDFSRAASLTGRKSIIALRSRSGSHSTIVASTRTVTTSRTDVDVVVTEHGIAELRGHGFRERAKRLAAIADPEFRDELEQTLNDRVALTA
jgi:acyl-CoA hydrolase